MSDKTVIKMIRKGSRGLEGTYENIEHHAKKVEPLVKALEPHIQHLGFGAWYQGHNVHELVTKKGVSYTLRPIFVRGEGIDGRDYTGIRLSLRISRSLEYRLTDIDDLADVPRLIEMLRLLAKPIAGEVGGRVQKHVA